MFLANRYRAVPGRRSPAVGGRAARRRRPGRSGARRPNGLCARRSVAELGIAGRRHRIVRNQCARRAAGIDRARSTADAARRPGNPTPLRACYQARVSLDVEHPPLTAGAAGEAKILADPQSLGRRVDWRLVAGTFRFGLYAQPRFARLARGIALADRPAVSNRTCPRESRQ